MRTGEMKISVYDGTFMMQMLFCCDKSRRVLIRLNEINLGIRSCARAAKM